jgi:hypothetical protein
MKSLGYDIRLHSEDTALYEFRCIHRHWAAFIMRTHISIIPTQTLKNSFARPSFCFRFPSTYRCAAPHLNYGSVPKHAASVIPKPNSLVQTPDNEITPRNLRTRDPQEMTICHLPPHLTCSTWVHHSCLSVHYVKLSESLDFHNAATKRNLIRDPSQHTTFNPTQGLR